MNHHDLLDIAEAFLLEPLFGHPEEFQKFRNESLYAPLQGSKAAKRRAQREALAAMGVNLEGAHAGFGAGRGNRRLEPKQ